jgi:hypothetical protein
MLWFPVLLVALLLIAFIVFDIDLMVGLDRAYPYEDHTRDFDPYRLFQSPLF